VRLPGRAGLGTCRSLGRFLASFREAGRRGKLRVRELQGEALKNELVARGARPPPYGVAALPKVMGKPPTCLLCSPTEQIGGKRQSKLTDSPSR